MATSTKRKQATTQFVGVFEILASQHAQASALLARAKKEPGARPELWLAIKTALISHEQGEMREVYPVLRQFEPTRQLANDHDKDASVLQTAISQVELFSTDAPEWEQALDQLIALVDAHVQDEETAIFPQAQQTLGEDKSQKLEAPFLDACAKVAEAV